MLANDNAPSTISGKFNPVNAGDVDYAAETRRLVRSVKSIECAGMDEILSARHAIQLGWWWSSPEPVQVPGEDELVRAS